MDYSFEQLRAAINAVTRTACSHCRSKFLLEEGYQVTPLDWMACLPPNEFSPLYLYVPAALYRELTAELHRTAIFRDGEQQYEYISVCGVLVLCDDGLVQYLTTAYRAYLLNNTDADAAVQYDLVSAACNLLMTQVDFVHSLQVTMLSTPLKQFLKGEIGSDGLLRELIKIRDDLPKGRPDKPQRGIQFVDEDTEA